MTPDQIKKAEVFLHAIDKIVPFGRFDSGMTPQQFRRWRVWQGIKAVLAHVEEQHK